MKKFNLSCLFVSTLSAVCFSGTFTYRLTDSPQKEIESCMLEAKAIAKKLSDYAGVETSNARCEWIEISQKIEILVDYQSEKPLNIVSTAPLHGQFVSRGFFKTLEDCKQALPAHENQFEKETGLKIVTSFCFTENYYTHYPNVIKIEGVGTPIRAPYYTKLYTDGTVVSPKASSLVEKLKAYFATKNAELVHTAFRTSMPDNSIVLFYYAKSELTFERETLYSLTGTNACMEELTALETKLNLSGIELPLAYCGGPFNGSTFDLYLFFEPGKFSVKKSLEGFKDYKTCNANKEALIQKYQSTGIKVLAGICQRDLATPNYRISLFLLK